MSDEMYFNISYDNMKKIIKNYFAKQGRLVNVSITNTIDTDRYAGTVNTCVLLTENTKIGGVESEGHCYLSIDDLKEIVAEVLERENKEVLNLSNNAVTSSRIDGFGMDEHVVESITGKYFTIKVREKNKNISKGSK